MTLPKSSNSRKLPVIVVTDQCSDQRIHFHTDVILGLRKTTAVRRFRTAINELSKDSPSEDVINSQTTQFLKLLDETEGKLMEQINYLSQVTTSQQHESSIYSAEKSFDLAVWKTQLVKAKLAEINKLSQRNDMVHNSTI
eukprot:gene16639-8077_t